MSWKTPFRYSGHLVINAVAAGQFVYALRLDEGGVHIEADEAAHAAVHIVLLEGEIYTHFRAHGHQVLLHGLFVIGTQETAEGKLHTGPDVLFRMHYAHAAGEALDCVYVQPVAADYIRGGLNLPCAEGSADDGEDVAVPPLPAGPCLIVFVRYGSKANADAAQLRGLEEKFLHHLAGMGFIYPDQDSHGKSIVDNRLAQIQYLSVIFGQNCHYRCGKSYAVLARNAYKYLFFFHNLQI